jgi:endonuclease/exonuclease/phosphatase family metal-dependent hydrolase
MSKIRKSLGVTLALALGACGACSGTSEPSDVPIAIPSRGTAQTFDVGTWNVSWFGDTGNGPDDETLQLRRVRDVIRGADLDLWGLEEVVGRGPFNQLVAQLPGYAGLLANDPSVAGGAASYSDFGDQEQKVALVYKTSVVEVLGAKVVLADKDYAFAGRPPLEVRLRIRVGGVTQEGVAIVMHAKADTQEASWARRRDASAALKAYLDATWPTARVWVIGDFNDDVDVSISGGRASPYANFVSDPGRWTFLTAALSAAGTSTMVGYSDAIDHVLVSDEAAATYVAGSVEALRVDTWIKPYASSTSDHYPVLARFRPS